MSNSGSVTRKTPVKRKKQETFNVDRVTSHFFDPRRQKTYFKVKYTGYKGLYKQPAKDLVKCPSLVEKMESKKGLSITKVRFKRKK
jgi:hypothetical protein